MELQEALPDVQPMRATQLHSIPVNEFVDLERLRGAGLEDEALAVHNMERSPSKTTNKRTLKPEPNDLSQASYGGMSPIIAHTNAERMNTTPETEQKAESQKTSHAREDTPSGEVKHLREMKKLQTVESIQQKATVTPKKQNPIPGKTLMAQNVPSTVGRPVNSKTEVQAGPSKPRKAAKEAKLKGIANASSQPKPATQKPVENPSETRTDEGEQSLQNEKIQNNNAGVKVVGNDPKTNPVEWIVQSAEEAVAQTRRQKPKPKGKGKEKATTHSPQQETGASRAYDNNQPQGPDVPPPVADPTYDQVDQQFDRSMQQEEPSDPIHHSPQLRIHDDFDGRQSQHPEPHYDQRFDPYQSQVHDPHYNQGFNAQQGQHQAPHYEQRLHTPQSIFPPPRRVQTDPVTMDPPYRRRPPEPAPLLQPHRAANTMTPYEAQPTSYTQPGFAPTHPQTTYHHQQAPVIVHPSDARIVEAPDYGPDHQGAGGPSMLSPQDPFHVPSPPGSMLRTSPRQLTPKKMKGLKEKRARQGKLNK
ncbi:hypothetical protein CC80DRAFT_546726 [Byssothecium circinans]|uniref:Uncharacterized protein n=1 Tax=Byssothecium circinans TaxID=147558 RepID=A0A6A5U3S3_9PLEO|nr:hypothetical protein CC80DRAFT_546726 [Byssothecium circinans]